MVSNIIDINADVNKHSGTYNINWSSKIIKLLGNKVRVYSLEDEGAVCNILLLHAYGYGCCGQDWNLHLHFLLKNIKANVYSVDFPGFGDSEGKKFTSRA
jgi:pimeloyl-ACP methyl ester carboxylesterase